MSGKQVLFVMLLCLPGYSNAQTIIDASRRVDWSHAGIPGAIPNRTTICATLTVGATAIQINNAIAACPAGQVVFLKAGTYNLSGGIDFAGKSNVTLRGAGANQTFLVFTGSTNCLGLRTDVCVRNSELSYSAGPAHTANWTAGYAKGSTEITLDTTAGLSEGNLLILDQLNDAADVGGIFVCSSTTCADSGPSGAGRTNREQAQLVRVTGINGNVVSVSPGLYMANWRASQRPGAWWATTTAAMNGIENLTVDHVKSNAQSGIHFFSAYGCWIKNVKSLNSDRSHVWLYQTAHTVIRDSYFYGTKNGAAQSYGVESFTSSDNLVENNIFQHVTTPLMLNGAASGSVFAYNVMVDDAYLASPSWMMPSNYVHAAGVDMNLHEGNEGNALIADIVHGTHNLITAFRNRFTGLEPGKTAQTIPIHLYAYSRYFNIVGNVLGTQGHHTNYEDTVPAGVSPNQSIYVLGWSANEGRPNRSIANDSLVAKTLLRWGNYDYATGTTRWLATEVPSGNSVPADHALPASLYLSSKPSWWGSMPWPPIGPDVTGGQDPAGHAHKIPARVCYDNTPKTNGILNFDADGCYGTADTASRRR